MNTKKLFIKNLDASTSASEIESLFSIYGDVDKVKINHGKGLGFVEMTSISEARRVREKLDGATLWGRSMEIHNISSSLKNRLIYAFSRFFG